MVFQFNISAEIQLLLYLIPLMVGYQLGLYFFYQYHRIKDLNLRLNRILISYGLLIIFLTSGALFIQISRNFLGFNLFLEIFIAKIGWIISLSSPIVFLIPIAIKEFQSIVNIKFMRLMMGLSCIPIFLIILIPEISPVVIILSVVFLLFNGYYIFIFQIRLIKKVVGQIKKRMEKFLIGEIISLIAALFAMTVGLGIFNESITMILYTIGISILIIGFAIIFTSSIDFPPFYEFEWFVNLLHFYVINNNNSELLYSYNFQENIKIEQENRDIIISKGLTGIEHIIASITGSKDEKINEIKQEGFNILIEHSNRHPDLTYILLVKKDLKSFPYILKNIKTSFENYFRIILKNYSDIKINKKLIFNSFDVQMEQLPKN